MEVKIENIFKSKITGVNVLDTKQSEVYKESYFYMDRFPFDNKISNRKYHEWSSSRMAPHAILHSN